MVGPQGIEIFICLNYVRNYFSMKDAYKYSEKRGEKT